MTDKKRKNFSVDEETHEGYRNLAHVRKTNIARLLREALVILQKKYEKRTVR